MCGKTSLAGLTYRRLRYEEATSQHRPQQPPDSVAFTGQQTWYPGSDWISHWCHHRISVPGPEPNKQREELKQLYEDTLSCQACQMNLEDREDLEKDGILNLGSYEGLDCGKWSWYLLDNLSGPVVPKGPVFSVVSKTLIPLSPDRLALEE